GEGENLHIDSLPSTSDNQAIWSPAPGFIPTRRLTDGSKSQISNLKSADSNTVPRLKLGDFETNCYFL
ncbi:hypothetical protein QUA56_32715, partial [Microcoleus sp. N3A4]|uniref:hypothetical protein n=1 Tax=Microcoleus sp. N3A4 TaxID=3055379 RepID=UPI002FD76D91